MQREDGRLAEQLVRAWLSKLKPEKYSVLNNINLDSKGTTEITQIDHIVISSKRIFCIETKSHKGWIYGKPGDSFWTQTLLNHKSKFYNPFRQNYTHIKAMESALAGVGYNKPIISLVVFPFVDKIVHSESSVIEVKGELLTRIAMHRDDNLPLHERYMIANRIYMSNVTDLQKLDAHRRQLKKYD